MKKKERVVECGEAARERVKDDCHLPRRTASVYLVA